MKKTGFTLRADESPQAGVRRIADGLIDAALRRARRPSRDPSEDVHLFRTTTKRLRALLQLIRPVIARTAFERENARLKRAAGRLAAFRDRAVAGATLLTLGGSATVLRQIRRVDPSKKASAKGNREGALREAAREFERSRLGFQELRLGGAGWAAIGPGLVEVYREARRRMKVAFAQPSDRAFHRWRIRVKQLYYQMQWLEPIWPKRFGRLLGRLHRLEEHLGADHDLVVLRELLATTPGGCEVAEALEQVRKSAAKRSRSLRRASERLGAKALRATPRRFGRDCERRWRAWVKGS